MTSVAQSVSGTNVRDTHRVLVELVGSEVAERALGGMDPERRDAYVQALPVSWVPLDIAEEVVVRIAEEAGRAPGVLIEQAARRGVERTLRTVWRMLLRVTTDRALVTRAPILYAKTYRVGEMIADVPEPGRAVVRVRGWPGMSELQRIGLRAGIEGVLSVAGRRDVRGRERVLPDGAEFTLTWRV